MKKVFILCLIFLPSKAMGNGYTLPDIGGNFSSPVDIGPSSLYYNHSLPSFSDGINGFFDLSGFYFRTEI